jgi:hypothetical protein
MRLLLKPNGTLPHEEAEKFAAELRELGFDVEIEKFVPSRLTGVTWWEMIRVHLESAGAGAVVGAVAKDLAKDAVKAVAKQVSDVFVRWARRRGMLPEKNPKQAKCVEIYGPDGSVVRRVTVYAPDDEPEIKDS